MGHCNGAQRVNAPEIVVEQRRCKNCVELCAQEPQTAGIFREGELGALDEIVQTWSRERISNTEAKQRILQQVLRGQDHVSLALQSSAGAATQAGRQGAASGAAAGRAMAGSLSSAAAGFASKTSLASNSSAQRVGQVATGALGMIGMVAGGVVGGMTTAVAGGTKAGVQPRALFVFIDRVFLRSSQEQAWERAARELDVEGVSLPPHELEAYFRAQLRKVWGDSQPQTRECVWLKLVKLCLCLELLRHLPLPIARVELPKESLLQELRFDQDFLQQRVQDLIVTLGKAAKSGSGMTVTEISQRCPTEKLTVAIGEECAICLEPFEAGTAVRRLPCTHIMHKECCEEWLKKAATCPICRSDVSSRSGQPLSQAGGNDP